MNSVKLCAAKLGYTVIDRKITSKAVEVIARVCAKDNTKLFVFSDKDIAKIQQWCEGFGNESRECRTALIWDNAYSLHQQGR